MVRLKKAVPPTETGITRRAVADLQAQIENLTAAVAALSTQHATQLFHHERNSQAANDDEFEVDENPLSLLRHPPPIHNNNNDSYFDNKCEDLDTKVYDTIDNENSYVVQLGGPIFDVSDTEEEGEKFSEKFSEKFFDPIFDVFDHDDTEKLSTYDVADEEDFTEIAPIYDIFGAHELKQFTAGKFKDESVNFIDTVCSQKTPTLSLENFATSNGVIHEFHLYDSSPPCETMMATIRRSDDYCWESSRSNHREDHMDVPKPELIPICNERAGNTLLDLQKKHVHYGAWRKSFNRQINREPPDRVPHQGREAEQEDTQILNAKITKLEEALLLEQEKNMTLEHELSEIRRNIRMLNKGSTNLDKILRMGRTEKTTAGLGYQGGPSVSHTVFVRSNHVDTNKPDVVFESAKNPSMEFPTVSNVYTRCYEISLLQNQGCVRQQWSTGIMSVILKTQRCLSGEEFVSILQQFVVTSIKQRNDQYWHLHRIHMRLFKNKEVVDCNDKKVGEDVYPTSDKGSSEQKMISLGLEIPHHHSLESTLILNKVFLASILVDIHKNVLYMATFVSERSLQTGESHRYVDVLFERNTTFVSCWTNVKRVNWNINESSLSMNLIKENHAEVLTAICDISFPRRLVSPLGSILVYVFTGGEDSKFLWPLLTLTTTMRILGLSYNITVIFFTEVSHSLGVIWIIRIPSFFRLHLLTLRIRINNLETIVYWKVLHSGFYKLTIWDVQNRQMNLHDKSTTSTWEGYVTCVSSKYLWEAYNCVLWVHCTNFFLPLPSWIGFFTLIWVISKEVFPFQDPWNKVFKLLASYHLFHVNLHAHEQPAHTVLWSLLKIVITGELTFGVVMVSLHSNYCQFLDFRICETRINEDVRRYACGVEWDLYYTKMDSFDLLLVSMKIGDQSSDFFDDSSSHHVNQVSVISLLITQDEFTLKHRLWRMTMFFPLNLLRLGLCFDVNVGKLGVMRSTSFRFSYDDLMEICVWLCAPHINILEWFLRWVRPPSYLHGLVLIGTVHLSGAILPTGAFLNKVLIKEYLQLCDRMHFVVLFPKGKIVMCFVIQCDKVLRAKLLEYLEFWVSVHDIQSTRRTRFFQGINYVNWLEQDECMCDQAPVTLVWKFKGTYAIEGCSEERDKNVSQMVLFKIWEQRFPFRFEVESFKPGGT